MATFKDSNGTPFEAFPLPAPGAKVTAESLPIARALDDPMKALVGPVNETPPSTDTGASGGNGRLQRIAQRLTSLIGLFPASLGAKTSANSLAVTLPTDQAALITTNDAIGAKTDATATGDEVNASLIAFMKRSLSQATAAIAANSTAVQQQLARLVEIRDAPVRNSAGVINAANPLLIQSVATARLTRTKFPTVTDSTSKSLIVANANRKRLRIQNLDATRKLWVGEGEDASAVTGCLLLLPGQGYDWDAAICPAEVINIIGEAAGQRVVGWEFV